MNRHKESNRLSTHWRNRCSSLYYASVTSSENSFSIKRRFVHKADEIIILWDWYFKQCGNNTTSSHSLCDCTRDIASFPYMNMYVDEKDIYLPIRWVSSKSFSFVSRNIRCTPENLLNKSCMKIHDNSIFRCNNETLFPFRVFGVCQQFQLLHIARQDW